MILNTDQIAFARELAHATGLRPDAIGAWELAEEPASRDPVAQGHNWLNLLSESAWQANGRRTYSGVPVAAWTARFARFNTRADAVTETAFWIDRFSNYAGIRASRGGTALQQVNAIAASPWDAGHYGGGNGIRATLDTIEHSGIFTTVPVKPRPRWTVTRDGKVIGHTTHPKAWILTHALFTGHHHVHFDVK